MASLFRVKLQNPVQGRMDLDPSTHPLAEGTAVTYGDVGDPFAVSKQRQIWVAGPRRMYRLLNDGETFTDCNYWKQFAYPQCDYDKAFIEVLTDDGSVYSDVAEENTFGVGGQYTMTTDFADNVIDFVTTYGGPARFLQVTNGGGTVVTGELNGDTNLTFTLAAAATQVFNYGDLAITMLRLKGASGGETVTVLGGVRSTPTS